MTEQEKPVASASSRRWMYGANVVLIAVIAVVIVGLVDWVTNAHSHPWDWSTGSLNSLSPKSVKLLAEIDRKLEAHVAELKKDGKPVTDRDTRYELVSQFSGGAPDKDGRDRAQQVADLLNNYARASRHIAVTAPPDLTAAIRERYAGELGPYESAVRDFEPFAEKMAQTFKSQAAAIGQFATTAKLDPDQMREAQALQGAFSTGMPKSLRELQQDIKRATDSTAPKWGDSVDKLKKMTTGLAEVFKQLQAPDPQDFSKPTIEYLKANAAEFKKAETVILAYKEKLDKLPALKVDEVLNSLDQNSVVLLGPDGVRVIDTYAMYKPSRGDDSSAPKSSFEGEQAITSALLAMSEPNKQKVVFVTASPQRLTAGGDFSDISDELKSANFDVLEWSPAASPPGGPEGAAPSGPPPASGKGVVWIVLPPEAPNPQMMMMGMPPPNPKPLVDAVQKHLDAGGNALFLAEASMPMSMMGGGGGYPFTDMVKAFGIEVKSKFVVVSRMPDRSGEHQQVVPGVMVTRYPNTAITAPMQSLQMILASGQSRTAAQSVPTVVDSAAAKPAGLTTQVILETAGSDDVWGEANFSTPTDTTFDPKEDLRSPVPMGVIATTGTGQKVAVIGSKGFATNEFLESMVPVQASSGTVYGVPAFPGNSELLVNCVQWLANNENMIAVSPQANVALRIDPTMSPAKEAVFRWGSFLLPPILAIVAGTLVFWMRRR